jgi:hypothetical protein
MLWSFFAEEFSKTATKIKRTVSGAVQASTSALAAGHGHSEGKGVRPSMLAASNVVNTTSTDDSKEKARKSLKFKMVRFACISVLFASSKDASPTSVMAVAPW